MEGLGGSSKRQRVAVPWRMSGCQSRWKNVLKVLEPGFFTGSRDDHHPSALLLLTCFASYLQNTVSCYKLSEYLILLVMVVIGKLVVNTHWNEVSLYKYGGKSCATLNNFSWIHCSDDFGINQTRVLATALCINLSEWLLCRQENLSLSLLVRMSGIMLGS